MYLSNTMVGFALLFVKSDLQIWICSCPMDIALSILHWSNIETPRRKSVVSFSKLYFLSYLYVLLHLSVTETHARHRCSGCCLDIIAKIKNKKLLSIAPPSKLLSVHLKTASFFFLLKQSRFPSPLLLYSHVYWQRKLLKENSKYHKVKLVLWYLGEKWTLKNNEITTEDNKHKERDHWNSTFIWSGLLKNEQNE